MTIDPHTDAAYGRSSVDDATAGAARAAKTAAYRVQKICEITRARRPFRFDLLTAMRI